MDTQTRGRISKRLITMLPKNSGRDNTGRMSVRHQGGRHKRFYRQIDWKRDKHGMVGQVVAVEYDPNRTAHIALIQYTDGERRYIVCPEGLEIGAHITANNKTDIIVGNALTIEHIPIATPIHNIELRPGMGAQVVRSAGSSATILSKEGGFAQVKLPSGEIRLIPIACFATIGQIGNIGWEAQVIGSAGRARHMGIRPTVRGVAQNPHSHPHGGGEGRSGIGMNSPKSPWGKKTLGKRTRNKKKSSNKFIVKRRK